MDSGFDQCPYFCTKLITGNITLNQTAALCFVASATVCACKFCSFPFSPQCVSSMELLITYQT